MTAVDNVSKYQFHEHAYSPNISQYYAYKGNEEVGSMSIYHHPVITPEGEAEVAGMRVAPGHRHITGTMIGIAASKMAEKGLKMTPSDDLSEHSSRLVGHLQDRGLVTGTRFADATNDIDFLPSRPVPATHRLGQRLNTDEVNEGRQHIRRLLKRR